MSLISRVTTWVANQILTSSALNGEFNNIVNLLNNLDAGTTTWDIVSTKNSAAVPLIADNGTGSTDVADFKVNGSTKVKVTSTGVLDMGSSKITSLANATAATDAVAFGQLHILQVVFATTTSGTSTTSATFQSTNCAASITPSSTSNKVLVIAQGTLNNATQGTTALTSLFRGSTNLSGAGSADMSDSFSQSGGQLIVPCSLVFEDSPVSTSSTTYTVKIASDGTHTVSWVNVQSSIVLMEIA